MHIITSNQLGITELKSYHDNFVISHVQEKAFLPYANAELGYQFDIYHQDGMDLTEWEDYEDTPDIHYIFHPVPSIRHALDQIAESLIQLYREEQEKSNPIELGVVSVCEIKWNHHVERILNTLFNQAKVELTCLNLYKYMKIADPNKLTKQLKDMLHSDYIYPEDPVAYGYALMCAFGGMIV